MYVVGSTQMSRNRCIMSWPRPAINPTLPAEPAGMPQARLEGLLRARLERCRRRGDQPGEARAARTLASLRRQQGQAAQSIAGYQSALALHRQQEQWLSCADVLLAYADFLRSLRRAQDAMEALHQARGLYLRHREALGLALTEVVQAGLHLDQQEMDKALASLQRAQRGATLFGVPEMAAPLWAQIASLHRLRREDEAADAAQLAAATAFGLAHMEEHSCQARLALARDLARRRDWPRAQAALDQAEEDARGSQNPRATLAVELERAALAQEQGQQARAERHLRRALGRLEQSPQRHLDLEFYLSATLGQALARRGDAEAPLLLGRAFDIAIMLQDSAATRTLGQELEALAHTHHDPHGAQRWRARTDEVLALMRRPG